MRVMQADLGTGLDIPERQVGFDLVVDKVSNRPFFKHFLLS